MTKTAETKECPGKCIHALASLLCGQVREDIQCPSGNMRCCVEKPKPWKKPNQNPISNNVSDNPTTVKPTTVKVKKVKKIKKPTTERTVEQPTRKQVSLHVWSNLINNDIICRFLTLSFQMAYYKLHFFGG